MVHHSPTEKVPIHCPDLPSSIYVCIYVYLCICLNTNIEHRIASYAFICSIYICIHLVVHWNITCLYSPNKQGSARTYTTHGWYEFKATPWNARYRLCGNASRKIQMQILKICHLWPWHSSYLDILLRVLSALFTSLASAVSYLNFWMADISTFQGWLKIPSILDCFPSQPAAKMWPKASSANSADKNRHWWCENWLARHWRLKIHQAKPCYWLSYVIINNWGNVMG